jgi:L-lactate dehydrogenase complex protein LldG
MASRDEILERLKRSSTCRGGVKLPEIDDRELFRDLPQGGAELASVFSERLSRLNGKLSLVSDESEAADAVLRILRSAGTGPFLADAAPLVSQVLSRNEELAQVVEGQARLGCHGMDYSRYEAGISAADFLVARTGSVVLRSTSAGGRRLSVLPPLHIVLARSGQLVASLGEALEALDRSESWSYATVITGPSRTADIEKILVLGAHGPRRLEVVLIR